MASSRTVSGIIASTLFCVGCAEGVAPYDYKTEPDPRRIEFQIGPLDQLSINVWKNKEMSADVTVRPDGVVTLPLIGDVKAAGRTPTELHKEIHKRLAEFVRSEDLIVSVGVTAVNSYTFTILGAAERSGYYSPRTYVNVVEAVAMAGGVNRYAGNYVYIVRGSPPRKIPIDMRRATTSEHANENLIVMRGDIIIIP